MQTRRSFIKNSLSLLFTTSLLKNLIQKDIFANSINPIVNKWLLDVETTSLDLKTNKLSQIEWQKKIEELFSKVELKELLRLIDFDRLTRHFTYKNDGVAIKPVKFPVIEGLINEESFVKQLFVVNRNRAIVPHGHHNMATMHMIIKGEMESWHYERIADKKDFIIIKPSDYRLAKLGDVSTISDKKDNVHWFKSTNQPSFAFNIGVYDLDPTRYSARDYLDIEGGEKINDGQIKAQRINSQQATALYSKPSKRNL